MHSDPTVGGILDNKAERVVNMNSLDWIAGKIAPSPRGVDSVFRLHKNIKDFVSGGVQLFWQRQSMFAGATLLTGYYFSWKVAFLCYALLLLSEAYDYTVAKKIMRWNDRDPRKIRNFLRLLTGGTIFSAVSVSLFAILVARQEGVAYHLTPLLFIFAAAIFAAMYNHQLVQILIIRLLIYGATLIYIPGRDLLMATPTIQSHLWLQFATTVFVLYFIVDAALVFLRLYRKNIRSLEALRAEHKKTKQAYEAKSQFLAVVSHELRTPLTSIKGGLDIANSGALGEVPPRMKPILDAAQKNSHRLADLIDDLLDLQKIEAGEMIFDMVPIDLVDLARDALESCAGYGDLAGVTFVLKGGKTRPRILGDYDRLMQVLANLLSNAAKFSKQGSKVVIEVGQTGSTARLSVRDQGVGIPENSKAKVFGRFSQVDSSDRRKIGGTGLGMNISRKIVEAHKAHIDYDSTVGQGTTFFIEFDIAPAENGGAAPASSNDPALNMASA